MENLKNQIFALLKKCPERVTINEYSIEIGYYPEDKVTYILTLNSKEEYHIKVSIYSYPCVFSETILLTEKEYMDIKWSAEEWQNVLKEKAFEGFKEFVNSISTSDPYNDLLDDES